MKSIPLGTLVWNKHVFCRSGFPPGYNVRDCWLCSRPDGGTASRAPNSQRKSAISHLCPKQARPGGAALPTDPLRSALRGLRAPGPWAIPGPSPPGTGLGAGAQPRRHRERLRCRHAPGLDCQAFGTRGDTGTAGAVTRQAVTLSRSTPRSPQPA